MKKLYEVEIYFGNSLEHEESFWAYDKAELYPLLNELRQDIYEEYAGYNGILTRDEVRENLRESWGEEPTEEEVEIAYQDEIDGWTHAIITYIPTTSHKNIIS